jgi:cytochrome P450
VVEVINDGQFSHLCYRNSSKCTAINPGGLAIIAGSDTTSSAVTNLFYFLLQNPVAFKRLQSEVDTLREDIFDFTKQAHLPYLNASL